MKGAVGRFRDSVGLVGDWGGFGGPKDIWGPLLASLPPPLACPKLRPDKQRCGNQDGLGNSVSSQRSNSHPKSPKHITQAGGLNLPSYPIAEQRRNLGRVEPFLKCRSHAECDMQIH